MKTNNDTITNKTEKAYNVVWEHNGTTYSAPVTKINDGYVMITYAMI